jgi:hypothetical protein
MDRGPIQGPFVERAGHPKSPARDVETRVATRRAANIPFQNGGVRKLWGGDDGLQHGARLGSMRGVCPSENAGDRNGARHVDARIRLRILRL